MKLEATLKTLDGLPEDLRENYQEVTTDDGGTLYRLNLLDGWESPESIASLKGALKKERSNAKDYAHTIKVLQKQIDGDDDGNDEADALRRKLESSAVKTAALEAIGASQGNVTLLELPVQRRLKAVTEGDDTVVRVLDDDGTVMTDADGLPLSPVEFVKSLRDDENFAGAFRGTSESGGGMPPQDKLGLPTHKTSGNPRRSQMSPKEKVSFIKEKGNDAFQALPY